MSNLFVSSNGDGSFSLTVPGCVLVAVLIFAVLVLAAVVTNRGKKFNAKQLVFSAAAIALAMVLSMLKLWRMPMGGSITLFSMLFVALVGYWYGAAAGMMAGVAYGLLQFVIDPYIVSLPQVLVDYVFAFGALGLSGLFSKRKHGLVIGYLAGAAGRFVFAFLSGVIFFGMWAESALQEFNIIVPAGFAPYVYSALYNGAYIFAEALVTVIVLMIPAVSKALAHVKTQAVS